MSDPFSLTGTHKPEPPVVALRAGALSAEMVNGNLRSIAWDGVEVLRAIAYLVRDRDWGTYTPALANLAVETAADRFSVRYDASCPAPDGSRLAFDARIDGSADGTLLFEVTAVPQGDFETNRCGFCILHPIVGLAGQPISVEHTDGRRVETHLPALIDPWQPFKDIRAITHAVTPGLSAECRMEGDSWEMEDQRNWTDASYKTYVRPLALPWPYTLPSGQPMRQSVRLSIGPRPAAPPVSAAAIKDAAATIALPAIGVAIYPEDADESLAHPALLEALAPQRLLLHFDPTAGHGLEALRRLAAVADACRAETTLECVVAAPQGSSSDVEAELARTAALARQAGLRLDAVAVSPSVDRQSTPPGSRWPDCPPLDRVYAAARKAFPGLRIGGGMFSYFTEINRKRLPADTLDFVTHCTCPIVHAADDLSVMQSLEALPFVTQSVRAIFGAKPYRIGPSTIAMRQNPYGAATKHNPDGERIAMADRDPRHNALFGAAWAAAYAARVAPAGLDQLILSSFAGRFGLIAGEGEPCGEKEPRPLFHVVRALAELAGATLVGASADGTTALLAARSRGGELRAICANTTPEAARLSLADPALKELKSASVLHAGTIAAGAGFRSAGQAALEAELRLPGYAVAFLS